MDQLTLLGRCQRLAGKSGGPAWTADDAIGFFQSLRLPGKGPTGKGRGGKGRGGQEPSAAGLDELFEGVPHGGELLARLQRVFSASGSGTRPDGMRDAYFVVRQPASMPPDAVEQAGREWLANLAGLDERIGSGGLRELLEPQPRIRVLVGKAPKHPRDTAERARLMIAISEFSERFIAPLQPAEDAALGLRKAYYYIACDAYLRDYLLWPLYRQIVGIADPLEPYFRLWEHGIKFRIFNDQEIDFYIPRAA